jgi:CRP/FNR family cyclic AMP-dependent transcriptional regulator
MTHAPVALRERLLGAPWARELAGPDLARVARETLLVHHAPGSVICREGEPAQHWIGVLDGMVKVDTVSADGRGTTFIGVSSGGWLGEGSLLKRERRHYEVVALRGSWIALVPLETFTWLFETSLTFNHFLVHQLNARLGQFVAVVESCRIQSTTAQVAVCLAGLFNRELCPEAPDVLKISHEELARLCGLSRQVAGRALHELEQAALVRMHYGVIRVLDADALHAFALNPG